MEWYRLNTTNLGKSRRSIVMITIVFLNIQYDSQDYFVLYIISLLQSFQKPSSIPITPIKPQRTQSAIRRKPQNPKQILQYCTDITNGYIIKMNLIQMAQLPVLKFNCQLSLLVLFNQLQLIYIQYHENNKELKNTQKVQDHYVVSILNQLLTQIQIVNLMKNIIVTKRQIKQYTYVKMQHQLQNAKIYKIRNVILMLAVKRQLITQLLNVKMLQMLMVAREQVKQEFIVSIQEKECKVQNPLLDNDTKSKEIGTVNCPVFCEQVIDDEWKYILVFSKNFIVIEDQMQCMFNQDISLIIQFYQIKKKLIIQINLNLLAQMQQDDYFQLNYNKFNDLSMYTCLNRTREPLKCKFENYLIQFQIVNQMKQI